MGQIDVEFSGAINKAQHIVECGDDLLTKTTNVLSLESVIGNNWKGDSASLFVKKYDKHGISLKKHAKSLKENAQKLKQSAEKMKKAEETVISIIKW